ncbi:hypothetical protein [Variovorax ginsengisoli]|uniref:Uncharacterized protein n=1 Tax=Variovorax ginsengisoli TaxID=363844 RepID=A0ABT8S9J5_9BURK|nr:hypothetical protein [Variovorax ginsengisoli]MDN8616419.1 hypothetical protein [Variovorax ginsengisoli]MDO1535589.1 hypothetical protein [Variovorax ginsengisoli]
MNSAASFSGLVSKAAIAEEGVTWRLVHFKRIQTTLTKLIERHLGAGADARHGRCGVGPVRQSHHFLVDRAPTRIEFGGKGRCEAFTHPAF